LLQKYNFFLIYANNQAKNPEKSGQVLLIWEKSSTFAADFLENPRSSRNSRDPRKSRESRKSRDSRKIKMQYKQF